MALKKSELYSSLWSSCDELRGGMDASQYKDYVLVLLFIKYVSDKYADIPFAPISVPPGASFKDMVALKGQTDIGDQINKKIIAPLVNANKLSDMPDFHDASKLGSGKEQVDRLTNLIAIFENPALDFSKNRAEGDDILGDAYEYLMRHFATESGKSKGQFYTPAEVSCIIAQILGIRNANTTSSTTAYDPTCGSGSLLLKVADEARTKLTLYGQEKDAATSGLARMNMILHNNPEALIVQGNTLAEPKFKDGETIKTFDYVVANPPFSDKRWSTGLDPLKDEHDRFKPFGIPPGKQGDYAYLLHIVRSLKSTGKGACILPHGVLFRGNAEDLQDIEGHLHGGIPCADIDALQRYWDICPQLRQALFKEKRHGYLELAVDKSAIKSSIYEHPEFAASIDGMNAHFAEWREKSSVTLRQLKVESHPKEIIAELSEDLLAHYADKPLISQYDVYQHLMDYWAETMQDDCYMISDDGWKAQTYRIIEKDKKGKEKDKGWTCDLVPKALIVARYFAKEQAIIDQLTAEMESATASKTELEEEQGGDEGAFSELDKVNKVNVTARLKEIKGAREAKEETAELVIKKLKMKKLM
ncbi:class I SAM-dependent DNA methyltransferase [Methanolobus sp. ZRKC5]|uniref:type I restriction-modification system subunit M n=1 Tax=unclassified Methanolobus TaxID=2629569 RepID=UPI00313BB5BF